MTSSETSEPESADSVLSDDDSPDTDGTDPDVIGVEATGELPLDVVFHTLKNSRRRHVLNYLIRNGGSSVLSDLAERIAAIENDIPKERLTSDQRKRVYIGLYQCHLPQMDDVGVIDYNQARGTVELTDRIEDFERYLDDSSDDRSRRWSHYYAAISAPGFLLGIGAVLLDAPASVVTGISVLTLGAVAACSGYHWREERTDDA